MQSIKAQAGLLARIIVTLLALLILLIAYFWAHKPFDLATFSRLGGAALDLITVGALFAIAGGLGQTVIALLTVRLNLNLDLLSRAERFALVSAVGLMLVAVVALGLGLVGLFRNIFFWVPLIAVGLLLRRNVRDWLDEAQALLKAARPQSLWGWLLTGFTVVMLVLALLHSLAPPYSWDGMTYHLVGPQQYLADGRMTPQPENFYLGFPKAVEMLFSVTMSLFGRDTAAAPVHFGFGLLGLIATAGLVKRYSGSLEVALLSVVFLLSSFSTWLIMGWSYVDLAVLAMSAIAFSLADVWRETKEQRWLILLGLICGFALGIKYTSGLLVAAIGLYILAYQPRQVIRNGLICGIPFLIAFLPWMIRGALHYGNPIYPYLFDGLNWDAGRAELFNQYSRGFASLDRTWQLFLIPLTATIFGVENGDAFSFTLGPWLFTLPLLLPVMWQCLDERARRLCLGGVLLAVPIFVFWALSASYVGIAMQTRLMIALFPIMASMGAIVVDAFRRMPEKPVDVNFIVRALITITLFTSSLDVFNRFTSSGVGSYMLGQLSKDDYLFQHLATHPATLALLAELPESSQVRLLWEPRSYYCPENITCTADVLFDFWSSALTPERNPAEVFHLWHEQGDDYILFFRWGYDAYMNLTYRYDEDVIAPESLESNLIPVWTTPDNRYTLYTWADNPR